MILTHFSFLDSISFISFISDDFIRFATQVLASKSITCDLSELPHQQFCGWGNKYPWCSKGKVLGQSWRWCLYRSKVPLTDKEDCVQVPCKAELVRATLQISVGIAPPYLTELHGTPCHVWWGKITRSSLVPRPFLYGQGERGEERKGLVNNLTPTWIHGISLMLNNC